MPHLALLQPQFHIIEETMSSFEVSPRILLSYLSMHVCAKHIHSEADIGEEEELEEGGSRRSGRKRDRKRRDGRKSRKRSRRRKKKSGRSRGRRIRRTHHTELLAIPFCWISLPSPLISSFFKNLCAGLQALRPPH